MEIYQLVNGYLVVENAIPSMYIDFMQLFPKEKDFWEDLYEDEKRHALFLWEVLISGYSAR